MITYILKYIILILLISTLFSCSKDEYYIESLLYENYWITEADTIFSENGGKILVIHPKEQYELISGFYSYQFQDYLSKYEWRIYLLANKGKLYEYENGAKLIDEDDMLTFLTITGFSDYVPFLGDTTILFNFDSETYDIYIRMHKTIKDGEYWPLRNTNVGEISIVKNSDEFKINVNSIDNLNSKFTVHFDGTLKFYKTKSKLISQNRLGDYINHYFFPPYQSIGELKDCYITSWSVNNPNGEREGYQYAINLYSKEIETETGFFDSDKEQYYYMSNISLNSFSLIADTFPKGIFPIGDVWTQNLVQFNLNWGVSFNPLVSGTGRYDESTTLVDGNFSINYSNDSCIIMLSGHESSNNIDKYEVYYKGKYKSFINPE